MTTQTNSATRNAMQLQMFGCTVDELIAGVTESITYKIELERLGPVAAAACAAMSILSDAQEEISRGMNQEGRQSINRAKYLLDMLVIGSSNRSDIAAGLITAMHAIVKEAGPRFGLEPDESGTINKMAYIARAAIKAAR